MPYDPDIKSGGQGLGTIAGTDANVTKWSGSEDGDTAEVTTTGDYVPADGVTYKRFIGTTRSFNFTMNGFIDANGISLSTVRAAKEVSNLVLTVRPGKAITMPKAMIKTISVDPGGVAGANSFVITGMNNGPYTSTL